MKDYGLEDLEQMEQVWGLGITVKLWTYWMYFTIKFFSVSFVIDEKKYCGEKPFHLFWTPYSLAFTNSFLNILNKYNVLNLDK